MKAMILDHPRPFIEAHFNDVANAPLSASLNTGYAAAVAEIAGYEVTYTDFYQTNATVEDMTRAIGESEPDVLLIHWVYTWDDCVAVKELIASVKSVSSKTVVMAFGLFPTLCQDALLERTPGLDEILSGEFESALHERLTELKGYRKPLPYLPFPKDLGTSATLSQMNVAGSRGCYGNCSFCFIPKYYGSSTWRGRDSQNVLQEIDNRRQSRKIDQVYFVDPNFFGPGRSGQARAIALAEGLADRRIAFGLEARVNDIHDKTIRRLKECGLESVFLGIESASPAVLKRMRKGITPEQSSRAVRILQDNGVFINVGFLMFEADSTLDDLRMNYEFLESHGLLQDAAITANVLYHNQIVINGSPAYRELDRAGRLLKRPETPYEAEVVYANPQVADVHKAMARCAREFFHEERLNPHINPTRWNEKLKEDFLGICEKADHAT